MDRGDWERAAAIYVPLAIALMAGLLQRRRPRQFAACLVSMLWVLPALLALQRLNAAEHWWSFSESAASLRGMPLELLLGWTFLWGLVPQLVFPDLSIAVSATVMVLLDCYSMPFFTPSVHLGLWWLLGEAVAAGIVLVPALYLAQWTLQDSHLKGRAALQVITAGMLFLFFIPEVCFAIGPGAGWTPYAESLPAGSIRRMRYEANDGTAQTEGVRAMGRALEHLSLGWAIAGAALRIPGIWHLVQLLMDACGLGPRTVGDARCETR